MIFLIRHRKSTCVILRIVFISIVLYLLRQICDFFSESLYLSTPSTQPKYGKSSNFQKLLKTFVTTKHRNEKINIISERELFPNMQFPALPQNVFNRRKEQNVVKLTEEQLMTKIHNQNGGVSKDPIDFESIEVCIEENKCLPFNSYVDWRAQRLAFIVNHHLDPERIPPTLKPYPVSSTFYEIVSLSFA